MITVLTKAHCNLALRIKEHNHREVEEYCTTHNRVDCDGDLITQCDCIDKVIEALSEFKIQDSPGCMAFDRWQEKVVQKLKELKDK